jgi:hypothetical protein
MSAGYLGNPNLKKPNTHVDWTPELLNEYIRCSRDPVYFIETYMQIVHVDRGLIPFKLYDYQHKMVESFNINRNTIVVSARQSGKSVTVCAFILWYILFNEDKSVALLANKGDTAREILSRVELAYQHLPSWLQHGIKEWNKGSLILENNSRVFATSTSATGIRGYAINLLFIDEAAFIDNWDEFFTSVYPTISSGMETKVVLVSTPNGLNHFHAIWTNAKKRLNNYHPILVRWQQVPGRNAEWKQETLSGMNFNEEKFNQEYNCEFLGSSGTLIAGWKLKELTEEWIQPVSEREGMCQYHAARAGRKYAIVCDVSRGKGLDYSAFQVMDITEMPYQQVCVFRNNSVTPADYASIIHRTARAHNDAVVLVEINDIGEQVSHSLLYDFSYENILYTENAGRSGKRVTSGFGGAGKGSVDKGIKTTKVVKSVGCSLLKLLIEQGQMVIHDHETVNELSTFSRKANSYEAETGKHDDLVMCLVLFAWLSDQTYFKELTDINTLQELRDKTEEDIAEELCAFDFFVDDGREGMQEGGWETVDWVPMPQMDHHFVAPTTTGIQRVSGDDRWDWNDSSFDFNKKN